MSKITKLILSVVGVAAVVVPAILLIVTTSRTKEVPAVPSGEREIDTKNIRESTGKFEPSSLPAASSATPSVTPFKSVESSSSSVNGK